jgi:DNA-binding MarR family transcriptional regulator
VNAEDTPGQSRHIGLALWTAAQAWRRHLTAEMAARGVPWYGEGRAALIPHIGPDGVRMADLPARCGLTRQAVHQFVEALELDGVLRREADPDDRRGRVVRYTETGLAILRDADAAKRALETAIIEKIGIDRFESLLVLLATIAEDSGKAAPSAITPRRRTRRRSADGSSR